MKIEIEKREYDRLKSREEKLLAYYDWWLDEKGAGKDLNTIEEVINDNIRLRAEIKKLKEKNRKLSEGKIIYASEKEQRHYVDILEENQKLKEKVKELEEGLDRKEEINKKLRSDLLMYQNQYGCLTD